MPDAWVCPHCDLPHDAETVKSMMTVTEVLDLLGVEVDSNHKFTLRDERTPSVHDFGDHWWDFGAGKGGDVIDLVRELCRGENGEMMPYSKALTMLMHKATAANRNPTPQPIAIRRQPSDVVKIRVRKSGIADAGTLPKAETYIACAVATQATKMASRIAPSPSIDLNRSAIT